MKKIFLIIIISIFLVGCEQKSKNNNTIYLEETYTSCISPDVGQYVRNTVFDDTNCESVISFMTRIVNATDKTVVKMVWFHNDINILEKTTTEDLSVNQYPTSSLVEPTEGFLKGKYTIKIYIDDVYNKSYEFNMN